MIPTGRLRVLDALHPLIEADRIVSGVLKALCRMAPLGDCDDHRSSRRLDDHLLHLR